MVILTGALWKVEVSDGAFVAGGPVVVFLAGTLQFPSVGHAEGDAVLLELGAPGETLALKKDEMTFNNIEYGLAEKMQSHEG